MDSVGFDVTFEKTVLESIITLELSVSWLRLLLLPLVWQEQPRGADLSSRCCLTFDATVSTSRLLR